MKRTLAVVIWLVACSASSVEVVPEPAGPAAITHWIPCATSAQCDDGNHCTVDTCDFYPGAVGPGQGSWYCFHAPAATCTSVAPASPPVMGPCEEDLGCEDNNPCTSEYCTAYVGGMCHSEAVVDGQTCTAGPSGQGVCVAGRCRF